VEQDYADEMETSAKIAEQAEHVDMESHLFFLACDSLLLVVFLVSTIILPTFT
jgi:hypothetical protein